MSSQQHLLFIMKDIVLPSNVKEVIDEELKKLSYLDQNAPEFR